MHAMTQCHIPEDLNFQQKRCANLNIVEVNNQLIVLNRKVINLVLCFGSIFKERNTPDTNVYYHNHFSFFLNVHSPMGNTKW